MPDAHPLCAEIRRDYWSTLDGIEAARATIAGAVEELFTALTGVLEALHDAPQEPADWRAALGPVLRPWTAYCLDRASDVDPDRPGPEFDPLWSNFSGRDLVNRIVGRSPLVPALDALLAAQMRGDPSGPAALAAADWRDARVRPRAGRAEEWRRRLAFWEGIGEVTHYAAPFTTTESLRLALISGGRIRRGRFPEVPTQRRYDGRLRARLAAACRDRAVRTPLARAALDTAAWVLPTAFIEHWAEVQAAVAAAEGTRPRPRVLSTALGHERSPAFAWFAARARRAGTRTVGVQHGGYYGLTQPVWYEQFEHEQSDAYATWGYRHRAADHPMPSVRLAQLPRTKVTEGPARRVLWILTAELHTPYTVAATPHYRRFALLDQWFVAAAAEAAASTGLSHALRPSPRAGATAVVGEWPRRLPGLAVEADTGWSLVQHAAAHDVAVFNYPGATGFLECLAAGVPALVACPPSLVPVHDAARPLFDALAAAGVYLTSEDALSRTLSELAREGRAWWRSPRRVAAVDAFRRAHAWTVPDALVRWRSFYLHCAQAVPATAPDGVPPP